MREKFGNLKIIILMIVIAAEILSLILLFINGYSDTEIHADDQAVYGTLGNKGRIYIPSLEISVPLYLVEGQYYQDIVDDEDSAAWIPHDGSITFIADHAAQEFKNLSAVKPKDVLYIVNDTSRDRYICYKTELGNNSTGPLLNTDSENVVDLCEGKTDDLCVYTCLSKTGDVFLSYWTPDPNSKQ